MSESREIVPYLDSTDGGQIDLPKATIADLADPIHQRHIILSSGTPISEMNSDDVQFVTILVDDSGSMASHTDAVTRGQQRIIRILQEGPRPDTFYLSTQVLNGRYGDPKSLIVGPYNPLTEAAKLDQRNYRPEGGTPLATRTHEVLLDVLNKVGHATEEWKTVRSATLIMTDGGDTDGNSALYKKVKDEVTKMRETRRHIVAAMAFGVGQRAFTDMFTQLGLDPQWILTTNSTDQDIYNALTQFGQAASQAAASEETFQLLLESGFKGITPYQGQ